MRKRDWLISMLLIILGLHCLVMSSIISSGAHNHSYFLFLLRICFWMGIPLLVGAIIYIIIIQVNKRKGRHS